MVFSCWVYRSLFVLTHVLFQIREMMGDPLLSNYTVIILVNGLVFMFQAVINELAFSKLIVLNISLEGFQTVFVTPFDIALFDNYTIFYHSKSNCM